MATLVSPGVSVSVIDESQYVPAAQGSVPLLIVATATNKADSSGTAVAAATTAANAGKLYQVTSQRDLVNLYGTPFFYSTSDGTPLHGYELNEYGLLAAYSVLGVTNRCYVLRADVDLAGLVGSQVRPAGYPDDGLNWYDTSESKYGIFEFSSVTGSFTNKLPIVIETESSIVAGKPLNSIGNVGDYAVNTMEITGDPTNVSGYFYKTVLGWVVLGSTEWFKAIPTVQATTSNPVLNVADSLTIGINGISGVSTTISGVENISDLLSAITSLNWQYLTCQALDGKLRLFLSAPEGTNPNTVNFLSISGTGSMLNDLGIDVTSNLGIFNQPSLAYGSAAQMPLWTSAEQHPRPNGSVWFKTNSAGLGASPVVKTFNSQTKTWVINNALMAASDWEMTSTLDASGGAQIKVGTIYAQYGFNNEFKTSPVLMWRRVASGATVVTGMVDQPSFVAGGTLKVQVSIPGTTQLTDPYSVVVPASSTASDFVEGWLSANIPYTSAAVTPSGGIQLLHIQGGEIILDDYVAGVSSGLLEDAGFTIGVFGSKSGPSIETEWVNVPVEHDLLIPSLGDGNVSVNVLSAYNSYKLIGSGVSSGGLGYSIGDFLLVKGSDLGGLDGTHDLRLVVTSVSITGAVTGLTERTWPTSHFAAEKFKIQLSNWREFVYVSNDGAPVEVPQDGTTWYYTAVNQVDIMVNKGGAWRAYNTLTYDRTGRPMFDEGLQKLTDPMGPIFAADAPSIQSRGTPVVYGDLWIDTGDLENYPKISRWEQVNNVDQWVLIDNTDNVSSRGIIFADARWGLNGNVSPADGVMPAITDLLVNDPTVNPSGCTLDLDAPEAVLYSTGILLFNTRRSGYNVKQFKWNYFNSIDYPDEALPIEQSTWVTLSGNKSDGSPYMGRHAQRASVVQAMKAAVSTNTDIRVEDNYFTLMAAPAYPELQSDMVSLNNERGMTAFVIGDTPFRLAEQATAIQNWATNYYNVPSTGEEGLVTRDTYLGVFYPSGITTDLTGKPAVVPPSHMMLRTFIKSDGVSYPWIAAAGTRRGMIDNATNIGYLDPATGEFIVTKVRVGLRDVMYVNQINPLTFFTGVGLLNYGNKTSFNSQSALDRINVARLINYVRYQLNIIVRPFVFEPNDVHTRAQVAAIVSSLMSDLMSKRGIYDYSVVCDGSNNTPDRIDRNELWCDVAIEPVKAAEFIYIPVRVVNTGELGNVNGSYNQLNTL